jgi:membrane-bound lytic murein transglycosylase D
MNRLKPLALSLSLLFSTLSGAHAADMVSTMPIGISDGMSAGLDMMRQNSDPLRTGDNVWDRVKLGFQMNEVNPELVQRQERYYSAHPEMFNRIVGRSNKYMYYVLNEVERRGMPTEIALLPMVESAFIPSATSPVGAAGLWQFMPETGRRYGLEQTWWYDGRRDVTVATNAALDYLQTLYAQFGDWSLALAAYNWGEGNVERSILRAQAAGMVPTYENIRLPNETRNYVPKLLAMRNLLADPGNFGIHLDKFPDKPYFVAVNPARHMDITLAAQMAGISVKEFKDLNPAFNMPVYAYKAGREMLLPADRVDNFQSNLAKWDKPLLSWQVYTPNTPESVTDLANRVGMSSAQLMAVNHMNTLTLSPGRPVLIAMKSSDAAASTLAAIDSPAPALLSGGEMLSNSGSGLKPAQPTQVAQLPAPALDSGALAVAQSLVAEAEPLPAAGSPALHSAPALTAPVAEASPSALPQPMALSSSASLAAPLSVSTAQALAIPQVAPHEAAPIKVAMADLPVPQMAQAAATQHTVEAGDTLYNIAHRFNLSVSELKLLNQLHGNSVKIGQTLQLKPPVVAQMAQQAQAAPVLAALPGEYVVQHGDTLFSIARHFGIERSQLLRLNDSNALAHLHPGQVLKLS